MKKILPFFTIFFLLITFQIYSAPSYFGAKLLSSTESDPDCFIDHKVNVINGDYCEVVTDLIIKGPDNLIMQRFFSNSNYMTGEGKGGWRIFPQCWLTVGKDPKGNHCEVSGETYYWTYAFTGERSGSILTYSGWESRTSHNDTLRVWGFKDGRSISNSARGKVSGQTNVQNNVLRYQAERENYTLILGDGTERYFDRVDDLPSCHLGEELNLVISEKVKNPEHFRLVLERLPSGNKIRYQYDESGHLARVEMLNSSEDKIFSWISLTHQPDQLYISTSDERNITYTLNESSITQVDYSYQPSCSYNYNEDGKLIQKALPGKSLLVEYDEKSRVACLKDRGENTNFFYGGGFTEVINAIGKKTIYRFNTREQLHSVEHFDLGGSIYRVDRKYWETERERYGRLLTKTIEDENGNTISAHCFTYDDKGNVIQESLYGNLTGKSDAFLQMGKNGQVIVGDNDDCHLKKMEYSQNDFNLLTKIGDCKGNETVFEYLPGTNQLIKKYIKDNKNADWKAIQQRTFYSYNEDGVVIEIVDDDGHDVEMTSTYGVTERHITTTIPKEDLPNVGLPQEIITHAVDPKNKFTSQQLKRIVNTYDPQGNLLKEENYDANNSYCFAKTWEYDAHGHLIKETNAEEQETLYTYDLLGNCTSKQIPHQNLAIEYLYNKQCKIIEIHEDYGPTQKVLTNTYDPLGRITSSTDRLGSRTDYEYDLKGFLSKVIYPAMVDENGNVSRPIESYENDMFGNPLITTDPKGYQLFKRYNIRGNPISIDYPDGTYELFKYDPEGSIHRHLNRDKIISVYEYDFLGRQINEERTTLGSSGFRSWLDNIFCKYSTYHLTNIKEKGCYTCYEYDTAGRPSKVFRPSIDSVKDDENSRKEEYVYDSLGRVSQIKAYFDCGEKDYTIEHIQYDLANRVIEKWIDDADGKKLQGFRYIYDKRGLLIEEQALLDAQYITVIKTDYNELGEPTLIVDGEGRETHFIYETILDEASQKVLKKTVIDPSGVATEMKFDAFHRSTSIVKISTSGELLSKQALAYDLAGNKTSEENYVISPTGCIEIQRTCYTHGPMNRIEEMREAADGEEERVTCYTYNEEGKLSSKLMPGTEIPITYTYDKQRYLDKIFHKGKSKKHDVSFTYSYDKRKNIVSARTHDGTTISRKYNVFDEVVSETIKDNKYEYTIKYDYDRKGRITRILLPDGSAIKYSFNALNGKSVSRISSKGNIVYSHEYKKYDEWGRVKEEEMIGFAGKKKKGFNLNGQPTFTECDFYKEQVLPDGYDALGNLLKLHREGEFEPNDLTYTYNFLSQLTSEKGESENTYTYDSIGNRLKKNDDLYNYDSLNQLLSTSQDNYTYTPQGTLSQQTREGKKCNFETNILGQLITTTTDDNTLVEFSYDPFGRRLSKRNFNENKNKLSDSMYLYFGTQEVGRIAPDGNIYEIRIPGLSSEESIAFELKGKTVAPLYDMRGNVVALIDPQWREVIESYTYSAFGEQKIFDPDGEELEESHYLNPWGYSGKRKDQETGLMLIGHRYYDPDIGRWISPDPALFIDGPNLYAYCQNNPLYYFDLYGLSSENKYSNEFKNDFYGEVEPHCYCEKHRSCKRGGSIDNKYGPEAMLVSFLDHFEDSFENKSRIYDLSAEKIFSNLTKGMIFYYNGINTSFEEANANAIHLSKLAGGYNIQGIYNATHGVGVDALEYFLNKFYYCATPPVRLLHQKWDAYFANADPNIPLLVVCHSQGAVHIRNALMCYPKELRERIIVVAIAPGAYIHKSLCKQVTHYVTKFHRDFIPWIDIEGRIINRENVIVLPSHKDAPYFDHSFRSPTYEEALYDEIKCYKLSYGL